LEWSIQTSPGICCGLAPAINKETLGHSLAPPPWWDEEENRKKKAKLTGWDQDSLTKQQRKRKLTTIVLIERIYKARDTQCNFLIAQCPARS